MLSDLPEGEDGFYAEALAGPVGGKRDRGAQALLLMLTEEGTASDAKLVVKL